MYEDSTSFEFLSLCSPTYLMLIITYQLTLAVNKVVLSGRTRV
jgi:hypothetical protein